MFVCTLLKIHTHLIKVIKLNCFILPAVRNLQEIEGLDLSRIVRKPDFCLGENKGADQLRGNREADQRLCFRYSDSIIPLLLIAKISSI